MRFTLQNQNNEKFVIIAMDLRTNVYLLGKLCEEKSRIFIVIVAKSNSLEIWDCEKKYYFKDYDRAYEQFYKENLCRMDNEKVTNIHSFMYSKVDYFSKFKTICLDEYPDEFNNYEKKDWENFYYSFIKSDSITGGLLNNDILELYIKLKNMNAQ